MFLHLKSISVYMLYNNKCVCMLRIWILFFIEVHLHSPINIEMSWDREQRCRLKTESVLIHYSSLLLVSSFFTKRILPTQQYRIVACCKYYNDTILLYQCYTVANHTDKGLLFRNMKPYTMFVLKH